jgi:GAF domain-containing protein
MDDANQDPPVARLKEHLRGLGVRAILFAPMLIAGSVAGIIGIRFKQKRAFRKEEIELTRALAHQAMLAMQLTRLSAQSRQTAVTAERNRMARDIHDTLAELEQLGDDFDYRGKLRDEAWVKDLAHRLVGDYRKLVSRGRIDSFAEEFQKARERNASAQLRLHNFGNVSA